MIDTKYAVHPFDVKSYDTQRLRKEFHTAKLMELDKVNLVYTHYDRFIYGGIMPANQSVELPVYNELKSDYFLERREIGILNIGNTGIVEADGEIFELENLECLYLGKGTQKVLFKSNDSSNPAKFYINSTPAHVNHPNAKGSINDANQVYLGSQESCNERVIFQYIHENGIQSCQLVMGFTELKSGSIWNTFPPHVHERRMEVYFYFDLPEKQVVMHFMGQPQETRHIAMLNEEAVVSPPWSIHSGAGTMAYKFAWGMGGENKAFSDMDAVLLTDVK